MGHRAVGMATFAIGDVHGCYRTLRKLLHRLPFDPKRDRLWLVGDLVNRGPDSLAVLRWARDLERKMGDRFTAVQGNHDLHLQARAAGIAGERPGDTLDAVLDAKDSDELVEWLSRRPLLVREDDLLMVHAGLLPSWTADQAETKARRVEAALAGPQRRRLLDRRPLDDDSEDDEISDLWQALAALTRIRTCDAHGEMLRFNGPPSEAPPGHFPWFAAPGRRNRDVTVVFGHWAALGLFLEEGVVALDSGCVYGQKLTAIRLDDGHIFQQRSKETRP